MGGGGQIISGGSMGQGQHLVVTSGGPVGVGHGGMGNMGVMGGPNAASVAAAIAASSNLPLPASSPPLNSSSVGSGNNNRPASRSSVGSKPMD